MFTPFSVILLSIILTENIVGIFGNGFIVVIYFNEWVKMKKLSSCGMILTCLGISRVLLQGIVVVNIFLYTFAVHILILRQVQIILGFLLLFQNTVDLWFAACLGIFYCVKITSCNQSLFLRMKQRISVMVPKMLLGSVLVSLLSSLPYIWGEYKPYFCTSQEDLFRNRTLTVTRWDASDLYFALPHTSASFLPFIIYLTTSIVLITSLMRHSKNMQQNATNFWDPSTKAHVSAIKAMISCLILFACDFIALTMMSLLSCLTDKTWTPAITSMVFAAYPSGHSLTLILINPKLRQAMVRFLHNIKCHWRKDIFLKSCHYTQEMSQSS